MSAADEGVLRDILQGLSARPKQLPSYLFYDERGSAYYEQITRLPEYYLTRQERQILQREAASIIALASHGEPTLHLVELGAGSCDKTTALIEAMLARQGQGVYMPVDVSGSALRQATARLSQRYPALTLRPVQGLHQQALTRVSELGPRRLVLFIGSSIGNLSDEQAVALLSAVRQASSPGDALLLGTDLRKSPSIMLPAYDDAAGVTAAFNLNMLRHLNEAYGADFELERFRHVALWNEAASRIEMHLESLEAQRVTLKALGLSLTLEPGERLHTESSVKYDLPHVRRLLRGAGWTLEQTWMDEPGWFGVHLARA